MEPCPHVTCVAALPALFLLVDRYNRGDERERQKVFDAYVGNLDRIVRGAEPVLPPATSMLGGLMRYLRDADPAHFQPMNSNFGLIDPLETRERDKQRKRELISERGQADFAAWMEANGVESAGVAAR